MKKALEILCELQECEGQPRELHKRIAEAIKELLAQPEQDATTDKPTATAGAVMPNGVCVSNVYDAFEAGRASVLGEQSEQEPVVWMSCEPSTGLVYFENSGKIEHGWIPLYTAPPKREPLSDDEITKLWTNQAPQNEFECVRLVEKAHGIGVK
jgi:hypothetical protein